MEESRLKHRAVFFDRDGVLVEAIDRQGQVLSPRSLKEFHVVPHIRPALTRLVSEGFLLMVVTNQPDIARKAVTKQMVDQMNQELVSQLGGGQVLRAVYVCPHTDADHCMCRKPKPGLLIQAAQIWDIDLSRSIMVGDRERDIGAGRSAGCRTVLMDAPYNQQVSADYRARNLNEAVQWILAKS